MIYTVYAEHDGITFIMKKEEKSLEVIGFYFGEPDEKATEEYAGRGLNAVFESSYNLSML